jgi:hypothetical protein
MMTFIENHTCIQENRIDQLSTKNTENLVQTTAGHLHYNVEGWGKKKSIILTACIELTQLLVAGAEVEQTSW